MMTRRHGTHGSVLKWANRTRKANLIYQRKEKREHVNMVGVQIMKRNRFQTFTIGSSCSFFKRRWASGPLGEDHCSLPVR